MPALDEHSAIDNARRFELLADSTPVMIWTTDAEGRIRYVNRAYMRFFGKNEDEVRRNGWQSLVHPDDGNAYSEAFFTALRQCAPFHAQARVMRHDGKWRWVESWGAPKLAASGALLGYVGSSPDITNASRWKKRYVRPTGVRTRRSPSSRTSCAIHSHLS